METITDEGWAVYSKEWQCFFGNNHCHYSNPESMVWCDSENKAMMLLASAKTYAAETSWEVVQIKKSWSFV